LRYHESNFQAQSLPQSGGGLLNYSDMKTVNSVSGGKSSAYIACNYPADYNVFALVRIEDKECKFKDEKLRQKVEDRIQAPFIATPEMDEIIYTIFDLEQEIGKKIDWVTGPTFEQVIKNHSGYLPNKIARFCTTDLKIRPIFHYLHEQGAIPCEMRLGFRAGEEKRLIKKHDKCNEDGLEEIKVTFGKHKEGRYEGQNKWETVAFQKPVAPLIDDRIYREDVNRYFKDRDIQFAEMNNCVGCWWRNEPLLNVMSQKKPKKFDWFDKIEQVHQGTFKDGVTYEQIKKANFTLELGFDDFSGCDSGYCGV